MSFDYCYNEMDGTVSCFVRTRRSTHILLRWQNILTKLPGVMGHVRDATRPFEAWSCLITNEILDNIAQHTNQYILSIQPKCSRESDA